VIHGIELIVAILGLALLGVPLFVIVGAGTVLSYKLFLRADESSLNALLQIVQDMEQLAKKDAFLAVPFFIAAGAIMTSGGIAKRLVGVARALVGWLPGGLGIASVFACMFFAAISGSSPVTLIAVGSVMFPAMVASKYPENFSIGLLTTAGSLGCLVPPSISLLIYSISVSGVKGGVTPDTMFLAGRLPALMMALLLCGYSFFIGLKLPRSSRQAFSIAELKRSLKDAAWALVLPVLILGGIDSGLFTPTEASAVACLYSGFVTVFIYRELDLRKLFGVLAESAVLMGSLILIIVLAFGLNRLLTLAGANDWLKTTLLGWDLSPAMFLIVVNLILILLGALMDSISATLIFAPLLAPIALEHGIDPIHFGIIFVVNMEIGYLAPPVATNLFVASAVFKKPFGQVTKAVFPTLGLAILGLGLVMFVPTLSKGLVNRKNHRPFVESFPWSKPSKRKAVVTAGDGAGGAGVAAAGGGAGAGAGAGGGDDDDGAGAPAAGGDSLMARALADAKDDKDEVDGDAGVGEPDGGVPATPPE